MTPYIPHQAQRIQTGRTIYLYSPMPEVNGFWNQWAMPIGKHTPRTISLLPEHILAYLRRRHTANVHGCGRPDTRASPA